MNEELTYSLIYTPSLVKEQEFNPVCSDKRIHIRFRDFDKPQVIAGFEKKLTYLLTYLMNFSPLLSLNDVWDTKTILKAFQELSDVQAICNSLRLDKHLEFKEFKVRVNYNRKDVTKPFGKVSASVFPGIVDAARGSLDGFLSQLHLSLIDYLFDDRYSILLHEVEKNNLNEKFINKALRKLNANNDDFEQLW